MSLKESFICRVLHIQASLYVLNKFTLSLVMPVIFSLLLTGCDKQGYFMRGPFGGDHLIPKNTFDSKLRDDIQSINPCVIRIPPKYGIDVNNLQRFKDFRLKLFYEQFSLGSSAKKAIDFLRKTGAMCKTINDMPTVLTDCNLTVDYIRGWKGLDLLGWHIIHVSLVQSRFGYEIASQNERILNVSINNIENTCYELDKELYQKNIIKLLRQTKNGRN